MASVTAQADEQKTLVCEGEAGRPHKQRGLGFGTEEDGALAEKEGGGRRMEGIVSGRIVEFISS